MSTAVTCRGCKMPVPLEAKICYWCKCPEPTCNISHVVPETSHPSETAESSSSHRPAAQPSRSWLNALKHGLFGWLGSQSLAGKPGDAARPRSGVGSSI